jgi:hypothetical protein
MPAPISGSIAITDLYPTGAPGTRRGSALPPDEQTASGKVGKDVGKAPAMSWLGLVLALVLLRLAIRAKGG